MHVQPFSFIQYRILLILTFAVRNCTLPLMTSSHIIIAYSSSSALPVHLDTDFRLPLLFFREQPAALQPVPVCSDRAVADGEDFICCRKACKHICTAAVDQCCRAEEPYGPADVYSTTWYGCLNAPVLKQHQLTYYWSFSSKI